VGRFQFGQIVIAYMSDGLGRTKERPAIVVSRDEENNAGMDLFVIAITKSFDDPCPVYHVPVHDSNKRDNNTGLSAPSVAKCNWFRKVKQHRVVGSLGYLDYDLLDTIVERFLELVGNESFLGWVGPAPDLTRDE
jgi:mRNA-degrading endonuclease toxin of MazEF toxin-antitoxin module